MPPEGGRGNGGGRKARGAHALCKIGGDSRAGPILSVNYISNVAAWVWVVDTFKLGLLGHTAC